MRRVLGMATATAVVFVGIETLQAQSLTSVPDNAILMVKVNNLEKTSQKLGVLMQQWGVAAMQPMLADPLATAQAMGNLQQGVNKAGEAAFVLFNPQMQQGQGGGGQPPMLIMVPVTNYDDFMKNFADAQADGQLAMITMPGNGEAGYMAKWGNFAALSTSKDLVANRPQASKAAGLAAKQLVSSDIIAYVNFAGFRTQAAMGLGFGRMMMIGQLDQLANQKPDKAKYLPVGKAAVNQLMNGIEHFINEAQSVTFAVDLSDQGVRITEMCEFTPESYLGKYVTQWKASATNIGKGLPEGKYAAVGAMSMDSATSTQLIDDMAGPVIVEAKALGADAKPFLDYVDALKESLAATKTSTVALSAGQGKAGEDPIFDVTTVMKGNAQKIIGAQAKMAESQNQFQNMIDMTPPGQAKASMAYTKAAKTVGGVSFDKIATTIEGGDVNNPQTKMLEMIYGKGGLQMLIGAVDNDTVVVTTAKDDAQITKAIAAAKGDKDILAGQEPTKQTASKLPTAPFGAFYIYGDQVMSLVSKASETITGVPLQMQLPADAMPVGMAFSTEGTAVKMDIFVPSPLVQAGVKAAMQEAVKHQQGQKQGGGL